MKQAVKEVTVGGVVFAAFAAIVVFSLAARDMAARATETRNYRTATFNRQDGQAVGMRSAWAASRSVPSSR